MPPSSQPPDDPKIIPDVIPGNGPQPHEDLTIAEELETMRACDEHRPGEQCFLDRAGERRWVADGNVGSFIKQEGARHASDYQSIHGSDWQDDFFKL